MGWAEIAERQHGLVTVAQLEGRPDVLVKAGRLEAVGGGVYRAVGSVPTWHQRLLAAVLRAGPEAVASRRAAAALWQLPGFSPGAVDVTRQRGGGARGGRALHVVRRLPRSLVTSCDGVPVTSPGLTLLDLCATEHALRMERAIDNALATRLVTVGTLEIVLAAVGRRGRTGTRLFREILESRGAGYVAPESELEALFLELIRGAGLPEPERQVVLGDAAGPVGRVDFLYRDAAVAVELDGRRWHAADGDREADYRRQARLQAAGWTVVRFTWNQLTTEPQLVLSVLAHVTHRSAGEVCQNAG